MGYSPPYPTTDISALPVTFISRRVPTFAEPPGGFHLLATVPGGKSWEVKTIWVRNRSTTRTYWLTLYKLPNGWIGGAPGNPNPPSEELYVIGPNQPIKPNKFLILNGSLGLGAGDRFYGFQIEETGIASGPDAWGLNMIVSGEEK